MQNIDKNYSCLRMKNICTLKATHVILNLNMIYKIFKIYLIKKLGNGLKGYRKLFI